MNTRRRTYEITFAGVIFAGITGFVLLAAVNSGTNPLFFAFGLMVGVLMVSALLGAVAFRRIEVVRLVADHAAAGEPTDIHYRLTNRKRRCPAFALRLGESRNVGELTTAPCGYCLHLAAGQTLTLMCHLVPARRGMLELREIQCASSFPFGFIGRSVYDLRPHRMVVYPRIGLLNRQIALRCREVTTSGAMPSDIRGGNDEFYGVREYRSGDNIKAIHWRRTARTGELMIREMTANAPPQMLIVANLRGWRGVANGAATVERAIEMAAALVCHGYLENFAVGLFVPGIETAALAEPRLGKETRARLLEVLATIDPAKIGPERTQPPTIRGKSRAEWIVVTLSATDPIDDLAPPGAARMVLAMDNPESSEWVVFPQEAYRAAVGVERLADSHAATRKPS